MSAIVESAIVEVLNARLASITFPAGAAPWRGASFSSSADIAWPGSPFTPAAGKAYLEANRIPNTTLTRALGAGDAKRRQGLFQVSVWWPVSALGGDLAPVRIAGRVVEHFGQGTVLRHASGLTVRIDQHPSIAAPLTDGPYRQFPVTVPYRAFAP